MRTALVLGGQGALGKAVVESFSRTGRWTVIGVDTAAAPLSPTKQPNVTLFKFGDSVKSGDALQKELLAILGASTKLSAVINAAGGWAGGDATDAATMTGAEEMLWQSLISSFAAAHVFATHGAPGGLLALTGAAASLQPQPGMLGYATAKAGVSYLCRSLAADPTKLPAGGKVLTMMPSTLDTPGNRAAMPAADTSAWTPVEAVAERLLLWSEDIATAPISGSQVLISTQQNKTDFAAVQ